MSKEKLITESHTGLVLTYTEVIEMLNYYSSVIYKKIKNHRDYWKIKTDNLLYENPESIIDNFENLVGDEYPIIKADEIITTEDRLAALILSDDDDKLEHYFMLHIIDSLDIGSKYSDITISRFYPSKDGNHDYEQKIVSNHDVYMVYAKKPTRPQDFISGNSYHSKDEMIDEFRKLMGAYLPYMFNYGEHLGVVSFSIKV